MALITSDCGNKVLREKSGLLEYLRRKNSHYHATPQAIETRVVAEAAAAAEELAGARAAVAAVVAGRTVRARPKRWHAGRVEPWHRVLHPPRNQRDDRVGRSDRVAPSLWLR